MGTRLDEPLGDPQPYLAAVRKKLKYLNKKLQKIEKYEKSIEALNKDQIESVERKPALLYAIKEISDLLSQLTLVDQEVIKKNEELSAEIKAKSADLAKKQALEEVEKTETKYLKVLEALYAYSVVYTHYPILNTVLDSKDLETLLVFKKVIFDGGLLSRELPCSLMEYLDFFKKFSALYTSSSDKQIVESTIYTYRDLSTTVKSILDVQAHTKFGAQGDKADLGVSPKVIKKDAPISFFVMSEQTEMDSGLAESETNSCEKNPALCHISKPQKNIHRNALSNLKL